MVNARAFWRGVFLADSWLLDLSSCLLFAAFFGAVIQVLADSGERQTVRMLISIAVAWTSYLLLYFVRFLNLRANKSFPSWFYLGILGSIVYAFNFRFVYLLIDSWMTTNIPTSGEFVEVAVPVVIRSFFIAAIVIPPLCVLVLLSVRFVRGLFKAFKSEREYL